MTRPPARRLLVPVAALLCLLVLTRSQAVAVALLAVGGLLAAGAVGHRLGRSAGAGG